MRRLTIALSALLVVQLALAAALATRQSAAVGHGQPSADLLAFDRAAIDGLLIQDGKEAPVALAKRKDKWVLPGVADAPADSARVEALVSTLASLKRGWPVATTRDAAARFQVADDGFAHKIQLKSGDKVVATLLVGTSPQYRVTNVRIDGADAIYAVALGSYEIGGKAGDWEDKSLLSLSSADITKIELPGITLVRDKSGLHAADLAPDEEMVPEKTAAVERELAFPAYSAILGSEAKPDYGLDKPVTSVSLTLKEGRQVHYDIGKMTTGNDYALRASDQTFLFQVPQYALDDVVAANRSVLVRRKAQVSGQPKPAKTAKGG
jgi:hypothetical protein